MSFLEYVSLDYIINGSHKDNNSSIGGGILLMIGIFGWLLLAIFHYSIVPKAAMVFNLIAFICVFISLIIKFIGAKKAKELNIIFCIVSIIAIVIAFVIGMNHTYHSIIYKYEYNDTSSLSFNSRRQIINSIESNIVKETTDNSNTIDNSNITDNLDSINVSTGIVYAFFVCLIVGFLFPFFCRDKSSKNNESIKRAFGSIGLAGIIIIAMFFIGQALTVIVYFSGNESLYDKIVSYHNLSYIQARKEFKDVSAEDTIQTLIIKANENMISNCNKQENCNSYRKENYVYSINNVLTTYGYKVIKHTTLNDNEAKIKIIDLEYEKDYYYYKLNLNDFSLIKLSSEDYDSLNNE